jgi:hypothetical protein
MKALSRLKRVILLDGGVHKEIGEDEKATLEAAVVVYVSWLLSSVPIILGEASYLVFIVFAGLVFWFVSAGLFHVLARIFGGHGDFQGYARSVGYCHAPMALGIIPLVGPPLGMLWALACIVVATKETHNLSTLKSCLVVFVPVVFLVFVLLMFTAMVGFNAQLLLENETMSG